MTKKQKISISVDETTLEKIDETIEKGIFRNRSHAFEFSLQKILQEDKN
jgi:Arc/MetJ-type ribon-helix-helix transcriptional regulator